MRYTVRTRNWNGNKYTAKILNGIAKLMDIGYWQEKDHDNKYYLETDSRFRAWIAWGLFMVLRPLSGGWTYIVCGNAAPDENYKTIYF